MTLIEGGARKRKSKSASPGGKKSKRSKRSRKSKKGGAKHKPKKST